MIVAVYLKYLINPQTKSVEILPTSVLFWKLFIVWFNELLNVKIPRWSKCITFPLTADTPAAGPYYLRRVLPFTNIHRLRLDAKKF